MFTGIVIAVGRVRELELNRRGRPCFALRASQGAAASGGGGGARIEVSAPAALLRRLGRGDSIAVNGCCLTVTEKRAGAFAADLSAETLARTALGGYRAGARVNLEPPLRMGDALGGHMLQGHVEGTGTLVELRKLGGNAGWWLRLTLPEALLPFVVPKGSLAVDGISLTVATLERGQAGIAIIPHTWRNTHLRWLEPGAAMNLETDPIARHIERLLSARRESPALSVSALRRQGF